MQLPSTLKVTEQDIDISNLSDEQLSYYQDLTKELAAKYEAGGQGRQVFTLSGPGGAGKSVVLAMLELLFKEADSIFQFMNVGVDAFHLNNDQLREQGLIEVKGRYDTYDTELLFTKLNEFKKGEPVKFPTYSRHDHNPLPDRLPTTNQNILLLLEGGWLLRNTPEWSRIRDLSSFNYEVTGSIEDMRENVVARHVRGGKSEEEAIRFYEHSDLPNTNEILKNSVAPDKKLKFYKDI